MILSYFHDSKSMVSVHSFSKKCETPDLHYFTILVFILGVNTLTSCSSVICGDGTKLVDGVCLVDTNTNQNTDPRCQQLCKTEAPPPDSTGDYCSVESSNACKKSCMVRIANVTTVCASCLLESAAFPKSFAIGSPQCEKSSKCQSGYECVERGHKGECKYCQGDRNAYQQCVKQVSPARVIDCDVQFRSTEYCKEVCKNE